MKTLLFFLFFLFRINLYSDNLKTDDNKYPFNYGRMEDSVYINPFFGFKIAIPSNWTIQNKTQIDYVMSKGKDIVEFKDDMLNKAIDKIDINSMTLLMVSKYELGAPVKFNPNIIILTENILMYPGIKNGGDYLFQVNNGLENSNLNYNCNSLESTFKFNKFTFYKLLCDKKESEVHLNYFTSIIKKYAFSFIITFSNDDEKNEILSIINTTEFTK